MEVEDTDIVLSTLTVVSDPLTRLRAIRMYCEGVKMDFPEHRDIQIAMNSILALAGRQD